MGPAKSYKTGAVVSSYPKPMLVLEGDIGGLDVIKDPIVWVNDLPGLEAAAKQERAALPPITAYQFARGGGAALNDVYSVTPDTTSFPAFNKVGNLLLQRCPWKTVVIDPITALSNIVLAHHAATQAGNMADPRKWASLVGGKVFQTISILTNLPCHVVFIFHSEIDKNELTSEVRVMPTMYARFRDQVGSILSQFFYQVIEGGKPTIYTQPFGTVQGVGARWPADLATKTKCGVLFNDLYGSAVAKGETEA